MAGKIRTGADAARVRQKRAGGKVDLELLARQMTAETGRLVTAEDLGAKAKRKPVQQQEAPPPAVAQALKTAKAGPQLKNEGWDGATGFGASTGDHGSVTGKATEKGDPSLVPLPDAETKASLQAQLHMMMQRKV